MIIDNTSTIEALKASISAWELKLDQVKKGQWLDVDFGASACPLCQMFYLQLHDCCGCPVDRNTVGRGCAGSPYSAVLHALAKCTLCDCRSNVRALEAAIKAELEYLRSLLEKEMKGGENERK